MTVFAGPEPARGPGWAAARRDSIESSAPIIRGIESSSVTSHSIMAA